MKHVITIHIETEDDSSINIDRAAQVAADRIEDYDANISVVDVNVEEIPE